MRWIQIRSDDLFTRQDTHTRLLRFRDDLKTFENQDWFHVVNAAIEIHERKHAKYYNLVSQYINTTFDQALQTYVTYMEVKSATYTSMLYLPSVQQLAQYFAALVSNSESCHVRLKLFDSNC